MNASTESVPKTISYGDMEAVNAAQFRMSAWVMACLFGEFLVMAMIAGSTFALKGLMGAAQTLWGYAAQLVMVVGFGAFEGFLLGLLQWIVLRRRFPRLRLRAWAGATALIAAVLWLLGSLPSMIIKWKASTAGYGALIGDASTMEPAWWLLVLAGAGGGLVFGVMLGGVQAWVLRREAEQVGRWVWANALAWMPGLGLIMFFASLPTRSTPVAWVVVLGAVAGMSAGACVGIITWFFLQHIPGSLSFSRLDGKIAAVTGASAGIGYEASAQLAELGAHVILICRNVEKAERTKQAIQARIPDADISVAAADLSSMASVAQLVEMLNQRFSRLDILVHNAGVQRWERHVTVDGLEETFAVNNAAPHLLTKGFKSLLETAPAARLVWVGSMVHRWAEIDFDDLQNARDYETNRVYYRSKLGSTWLSLHWSRQFDDTSVTSNVLEPGLVRTSFARDFKGFYKFMSWVWKAVMKPAALGALTVTYVAASPDVEGVNGGYYKDLAPDTPSEAAQDTIKANAFVDAIEQLTDS